MADGKSENISYRIRPMRREDLPQAVMIEQTCFTSEAWSAKVYREEFARAGTYLWIWAAVAQESIPPGTFRDGPDEVLRLQESAGERPIIPPARHAGAIHSGIAEAEHDVSHRLNHECGFSESPTEELLLGTISLMRTGDVGEIGNVAVLPAYRQQGIAGALVQEALEFGRDQGMQAFTLEVRAGNTAAIRLYEAAGFRPEGRRPGFYTDPAEDALILWKRDA